MASKDIPATVQATWQTKVLRIWSARGPFAMLLWPASKLFQILVAMRRQLYRLGFLKTQSVHALVLVVGNVIAGGAGKTPTVIAIVEHLKRHNWRVGVVSRGYGRTSDACLEVLPDAPPQQVGDEPLLVRRTTQVPVFVGRTRLAAANALLAQYPQTQILVCDDGLQHYAFHRDIEVCVFDDRGCGNGWLLPAGPLRETWPRKAVSQAGQHADRLLVLHTGGQPAFNGYQAHRSLEPHARRQDGSSVALTSLTAAGSLPLLALAGIAQPEAFFSMLRARQLPLAQTLALPDHYDFDSLSRNVYGGYQLICTEKDAHKLWRIDPNALAVPLILTIEPAFFSALDACIQERLAAKLSLADGHPLT